MAGDGSFAAMLSVLRARVEALSEDIASLDAAHRAELGPQPDVVGLDWPPGAAEAARQPAAALQCSPGDAFKNGHLAPISTGPLASSPKPSYGASILSPGAGAAMDDSRASGASGASESSGLAGPTPIGGAKFDVSMFGNDRGPFEGPLSPTLVEEMQIISGPSNYDDEVVFQDIVIEEIWTQKLDPPQRRGLSVMKGLGSLQKQESEAAVYKDLTHSIIVGKNCRKLMWHPEAKGRIAWDIIGMMLLAYDVMVLPLQVFSYEMHSGIIADLVAYPTLTFWTADIPFSFFTGFHSGGVVEMRFQRVAQRYVRTWLSFDFLIVGSDWIITLLLRGDGSSFSQLRAGRALRFLRLIRILRLVKVQGRLKELLDSIRSESFLIVLGIIKQLLIIIIVNHIVACGWYGLGSSADWLGQSNGWLSTNPLVKHGDIFYKYTTSLHWSWTQFTPASMEVHAGNTYERVYTVCVVIFAMCAFSSFVSGITNAMTRLRTLNADNLQRKSELRQFMAQHDISINVSARVWAFLEKYEVGKSAKRLMEKDVSLIKILPSQLKKELEDEVYLPYLQLHPFFKIFSDNYYTHLQLLYSDVLKEQWLTLGQNIVSAGSKADAMIFLISGKVTLVDHSAKNDARRHFRPKEWICEAALWLEWHHTSTAIALGFSDILKVRAEPFQKLLQKELGIGAPGRYARAFADRFLQCPEQLTDCWADQAALRELACSAFRVAMEEAFPTGPQGTHGWLGTPWFGRTPTQTSFSSHGS